MTLRRLLLGCLLAAAATCAAAGPDCSHPLTLALHDHGLLYAAETDTGIDRDVADELIRRSGCRVTVSVLPRARIWQLIESGALDFSLSGISTPQRDAFASFAWYFSNHYYLLVRRDTGVEKLADFERNPKLRLGVIRGFRYSRNANALVDALAAQRRVTQSSTLAPLYEVLVGGAIHGMVIEPFDYPQLSVGALRELTRIVDSGDDAVPHGLIMSNKSLATAEQQQWRALVDAMRADGSMQRIFEKYFARDLARAMVNF